jgi:hypothetical protein
MFGKIVGRTNDDMLNRTRSKADYKDQRAGSITWSKMHNINKFGVKNF